MLPGPLDFTAQLLPKQHAFLPTEYSFGQYTSHTTSERDLIDQTFVSPMVSVVDLSPVHFQRELSQRVRCYAFILSTFKVV